MKILVRLLIVFMFFVVLTPVKAENKKLSVDGLANVRIGSTIQLHAWSSNDCTDSSNCKYKVDDVTTESVWTSSDDNIATVSKVGLVTGLRQGSVFITATYKGKSQTKNINITTEPNPYKGNYGYFLDITISGKKSEYHVGDTVIATPSFFSYLTEDKQEITTDGPVLIESSKLEYEISDPNIAKMTINSNNNELIEFKNIGIVTIKFSYNWGPEKYTKNISFKVVEPNKKHYTKLKRSASIIKIVLGLIIVTALVIILLLYIKQ